MRSSICTRQQQANGKHMVYFAYCALTRLMSHATRRATHDDVDFWRTKECEDGREEDETKKEEEAKASKYAGQKLRQKV